MSTEILESSFSLYKQLEKQHSKSGFTSLLLTFPTMARSCQASTTGVVVNAHVGKVVRIDRGQNLINSAA